MPPIDLPIDEDLDLLPGDADGTIDLDAHERRTPVDGRHARSERSRQAMVDAVLDLLREGNLRPSSAQIAERAGVTQRTLFNQFGDMETLINAVAERQMQRVATLLPHAGEGPLEVRTAAYCDGLATMLEEMMHVRWAVVTNPSKLPRSSERAHVVRGIMRRHLADAFAPELGQLSTEESEIVLDVLEIEADPVVWRMRRLFQELPRDEAQAIVERTMTAVLRDAISR
jgi:TetR/AcrR family transcriptional regulator, regulator of autoinduction and epiphytic fitness